MRPDKEKVVDEVWDDERILSFLDKAPLGDETADFSRLLYAYRSMRVDDFQRFLDAFKAQGGDVNCVNRQGQTLADTIRTHGKAAPFLALLES